MPEVWYPGAIRDPGRAAGYRLTLAVPPYSTHNQMRAVGCHFTAGYDSWALIRDQGLAAFLATRDGRIAQFCEVDATTYQAGNPFNGLGPGIEQEYRDEPSIFTPESEAAIGALVLWLHDEWGIPLDYYDDPAHKLADWHGFISHRSVVEDADAHSDYWPHLPIPAPPAPPSQETGDMWGINWINLDGTVQLLICGGPFVILDLNGAGGQPFDLPMAELAFINFDIAGITIRKVQPGDGNRIQQKARAATGL